MLPWDVIILFMRKQKVVGPNFGGPDFFYELTIKAAGGQEYPCRVAPPIPPPPPAAAIEAAVGG